MSEPGLVSGEPAAWQRNRCVYCAEPTHERHPIRTAQPFSLLTCWRHVDLLRFDPMYAADLGEAAQARGEKVSR